MTRMQAIRYCWLVIKLAWVEWRTWHAQAAVERLEGLPTGWLSDPENMARYEAWLATHGSAACSPSAGRIRVVGHSCWDAVRQGSPA